MPPPRWSAPSATVSAHKGGTQADMRSPSTVRVPHVNACTNRVCVCVCVRIRMASETEKDEDSLQKEPNPKELKSEVGSSSIGDLRWRSVHSGAAALAVCQAIVSVGELQMSLHKPHPKATAETHVWWQKRTPPPPPQASFHEMVNRR